MKQRIRAQGSCALTRTHSLSKLCSAFLSLLLTRLSPRPSKPSFKETPAKSVYWDSPPHPWCLIKFLLLLPQYPTGSSWWFSTYGLTHPAHGLVPSCPRRVPRWVQSLSLIATVSNKTFLVCLILSGSILLEQPRKKLGLCLQKTDQQSTKFLQELCCHMNQDPAWKSMCMCETWGLGLSKADKSLRLPK